MHKIDNKIRKNAAIPPRGSVAERLGLAMAARGVTRYDLAKKVFRTPQAVSNWMTGRGGIGVDLVRGLATLLGVSPSWLAFGEGPMETADAGSLEH